MAWCKTWGACRVFYLALGHDPRACRQDAFLALLRRGTEWASQASTPAQGTPAVAEQITE